MVYDPERGCVRGFKCRKATIIFYECGHGKIILEKTDIQNITDSCFGSSPYEVELEPQFFDTKTTTLDEVLEQARTWLRSFADESEPQEFSIPQCAKCESNVAQGV